MAAVTLVGERRLLRSIVQALVGGELPPARELPTVQVAEHRQRHKQDTVTMVPGSTISPSLLYQGYLDTTYYVGRFYYLDCILLSYPLPPRDALVCARYAVSGLYLDASRRSFRGLFCAALIVHCPCPLSSAPRISIYEYYHNIYRVRSPKPCCSLACGDPFRLCRRSRDRNWIMGKIMIMGFFFAKEKR